MSQIDESAFNKIMQKHYAVEYDKVLDLDNIENKQIREYLKKADLSTFSHKNRIVRNIQILKYNFTRDKTNNVTCCFKMTLNSTSCIYAFLHCRYGGKKDDITYEFVCTGPTYRSQDGEYRNRFIEWKQFEALFVKYADIFEKVEKLAIDKMKSGKLSFQIDFYYPIGCQRSNKFEESINNKRLPIRMYILCWVFDFYNIHHKVMENHINPAYQYIMYQKEDIPTFESIYNNLGQKGYWEMVDRITNKYENLDSPTWNIQEVQCGQKIFPLSAIEAVKTDDIHFNVWREIYITNMASNLVLNLISPSFPFINNWFYIQNAHEELFDNISMHDKYKHSEIADHVSIQLKTIDKLNYYEENVDKGPISGKFLRLSKSIRKAVIYADSDIKLTDLAVCMTSEYVGRTLRDLPALIAHKEHGPGLDLSFTNTGIFTKHMFEYIYAFYCMNTKIGIMHGDLHMNNATIGRLYSMTSEEIKKYGLNDPHCAYYVEGKAYLFPHVGLFSHIIDFSRAIIGDYDKLEHEFSPRFAEKYFNDQKIRVLQMVYHYFPSLMDKYHDKIDALVMSNFPLMFKILTAVDTYVIMSNISAMFSIDDAFTRGKIKIAPGAIKLLSQLISHAEQLVISNIHAVMEGRISIPEDIEWPNLVLIEKNFSSYILTQEQLKSSSKRIDIIDIFNANNEVVYDIDDYDTWGPLLSLDNEIEIRKKYKLPMKEYKEVIEFRQHDESEVIESLTSKYEQQERDVLEFESWMML